MDEIIDSYFSGESGESLVGLSSEIQQGSYSVLEVIQKLERYFTNPDIEKRIKACEFLSNVLQGLKSDFLSVKEVATLSDFLCARLQDHYTLQPPVLQCLVEISKALHTSDETFKVIIETIFKEVHVQSCLQNDRYKIFQVLSNTFDSHPAVIYSMEKDFLCKYIECIDSEQDPRNLLIIFQLSAELVENGLNFYQLEEEFFDVTSCYFPIDFNPSSSGKKSAITNETLVLSLRRVISSSPSFSQFCIPLLIEKLESDVESAKLDSIRTFVACLKCYGKSDIVKFLPSILSTLKNEIMNSMSEEIEKETLNFLTKLVGNISNWPSGNTNNPTNLKSFLSEVLENVSDRFKEPLQDKVTWVASLIMLACAKGSKPACSMVVSGVLPVLLAQTSITNLQNLDNVVRLLTVASSFDYSVDDNPFMSHKKGLLAVFKTILSSDVSEQRKIAVIAGYTSLLRLKILDQEELHELTSCFLGILLENANNKVRNEVLSAASYLSHNYPLIVQEKMLPCFKGLVASESFKNGLECLAAISTNPGTVKEVASYVMSLLQSREINEKNEVFISECLNCLDSITKRCENNKVIEELVIGVAVPLIQLNVDVSVNLQPGQCCGCCDNNTENCVSISVLKLSAGIVRNLCQKVPESGTAKSLVDTILSVFIKGGVTFTPFNHKCVLQTRTVCLLHSSLGNFERSIHVPGVSEIENNLLDLCLQSSDQFTVVSASKTLAALVNKYPSSSNVILDKILEVVNSPTTTTPNLNILTLAIWTTKALMLSNHGRTLDFVGVIFSMFKRADVAETAAAGFDVVLRESNEVLSPPSHPVTRLMHKQRFFLLVFPALLRGFHESPEEGFYLTSLSHLLGHLPKQVLLQELPELMPLLVQSMTSDKPDVLSSVLSTLCCLLQEASNLMENYIATLLEGFLKLATFKNSLKVRLKAVMCIGACTLLPTHITLPLKLSTIKGIAPALDDPKRDVRASAARASSEWFLVGM